MKHASMLALQSLEDLLLSIRAMPELRERRPGIFYRRSGAFLHFHEDPAGLFADAKLRGAGFDRFPVNTAAEKAALLSAIRQVVSDAV